MANEKNLKKPSSTEEAREWGRKGGIASGKARRKKADLRKAMEVALSTMVKLNGEDVPMEAAICIRMAQEALTHGDVGAYKAIMKTIGHSEKTEADEKEQEARIARIKAEEKRVKAETERIKAEIELLKRKAEVNALEVPDDGFLDALIGSAAEDWADED